MKALHKRPNRDQKVARIVEAVEGYDLPGSPAWADLDALSTHTFLDGIEVDPDGIIIRENKFKGAMAVYVLLQYGSDKDDGFKTSDSFMGEFNGNFDDTGTPQIDSVTVDTSPFFEGERAQSGD